MYFLFGCAKLNISYFTINSLVDTANHGIFSLIHNYIFVDIANHGYNF
jgi:hypothetical protein